jgi:hypothetical protein
VEHAHLMLRVFIQAQHLLPKLRVARAHLLTKLRVARAHLLTKLLVPRAHLLTKLLVPRAHLFTKRRVAGVHLGSHGRKFHVHLAPELNNLLCEVIDPRGQLFECGHALLEPFYSCHKHLRRHPISLFEPIQRFEKRNVVRLDAKGVPKCRVTTTLSSSPAGDKPRRSARL